MNVREYTKELHHACEHHPVGNSFSKGNPPELWYAKWIKALHQIHSKIDAHSDPILERVPRLEEDLNSYNFTVKPLKAAEKYVNALTNESAINGAIYVLTGAHLMGGELMRKRMVGYPTKHLEWDNRKNAIDILCKLRELEGIGDDARNCFLALLEIMDEIEQN